MTVSPALYSSACYIFSLVNPSWDVSIPCAVDLQNYPRGLIIGKFKNSETVQILKCPSSFSCYLHEVIAGAIAGKLASNSVAIDTSSIRNLIQVGTVTAYIYPDTIAKINFSAGGNDSLIYKAQSVTPIAGIQYIVVFHLSENKLVQTGQAIPFPAKSQA